MRLRVLYDGIPVLDADGIIEPPDRAGAAPKIPKLPLIVQGSGIENDVIMDVFLVYMGADNEGVFPLGETPRQLTAQPVCFFRRDLTRDKGLSEMIGNHIVLAPYSAGGGDVLTLIEKELRICNPTVTLIAGNEPTVVCFLRILNIVDDVADGSPHRPAFAGVQGHEPRGCHEKTSFHDEGGLHLQATLLIVTYSALTQFAELTERRSDRIGHAGFR